MNNEGEKIVGESANKIAEQTNGKKTVKSEETDIATKAPSTTSLQTLSKEELVGLDYEDFSTPGRMLALANILVKGKMCPLKEPADVVIALMTGKELGIPFISSITQIYPINGTPTLGTHIQKGLALKNGIIYTRTRHYEAKYMFVKVDDNGKPVLVDKKPVIVSNGFLDEQPAGTKKKEIDRITEYRLTRELYIPTSRRISIMVQTGSFSLSEAKKAGLLEKDNWKFYPKDMLDARAFDRAMSEIADDIKHGLKSPEIISGGDIQEVTIIE